MAARKRLMWFMHYSIVLLIAIIIILFGVMYILQRTATTEAVVGEGGYGLRVVTKQPTAALKVEKDALLMREELEFKAKVKEVIKESLSFRPSLKGLSCRQVCEKAPGKYIDQKWSWTKITSECVAVIIPLAYELYSPEVEGVSLFSPEAYGVSQTPLCEEKVENGSNQLGGLCVCI